MEIGQIVGKCIRHMADHLKAGITTAELDAIGAAFLAEHGARSAPILAYHFRHILVSALMMRLRMVFRASVSFSPAIWLILMFQRKRRLLGR